MRELKFRCYLKDSYIERQKDYWWYEEEKANRIRKVHSIHLNTRKVIVSTLWGGNQSVGFDDVELMQFTGLYDIDNNPIYEGDILSNVAVNFNFIVKFEDTKYILQKIEFPEDKLDMYDFLHRIPNMFKRIGDIYDNKSLSQTKETD